MTLNNFSLMNGFYNVYMHGESGDVDGKGVVEALSKMPVLIAEYAPKDVYNMDEIGLFYKARPHKTLAQGKVKGQKIQKDKVTLTLDVNATGSHKLKLLVVGKSKRPRCFSKWDPKPYVWWHSNQTAWMKEDVFATWMTCLNNEFKKEDCKLLIIIRILLHILWRM